MRLPLLALVCVPAVAFAQPQKLTLEQVMTKTLAGPRARMALADVDAAEARISEAKAARLPRITATAFGTISPEIHCLDPSCTMTDPQNFAWDFDGLLGGAQLEVTQPLYTFGKLAHARAAARAGVAAQRALHAEAAGDLAVDAARAYWGVKVARELRFMLDDGIDEIQKALTRLEEGTGQAEVSIQDRQRIAVLLAEARVQHADAQNAESQALAGLRALTGVPEADVDDAELAPIERPVPASVDSRARPQAIAARAGAEAADQLTELARAYYWPDLALVGTAAVAGAQGVDDPPSVFANDPFNRTSAGLVLALRWTAEPWSVKARVDHAKAEADKARAQAELASIGASYDGQLALAEAVAAHAKVQAAANGEQAARTWLASVLQAEAIGTAEPRELADSYIAWFQMRARWAQAVNQWNVAVVRLDRAAGAIQAPTPEKR